MVKRFKICVPAGFAFLLLCTFFTPVVVSHPAVAASYSNPENGFYVVRKQVCFTPPEVKSEDGFVRVTIPECTSYMMNPGEPMLPFYTETMVFPVETEILNISFTSSSPQETLKVSRRVVPAPQPVPLHIKNEDFDNTMVLDEDVYSSHEPYPNTWFSYTLGRGLDNGRKTLFLTLNVFPVQYIPGENKIRYITEMDYVVTYKPLETSSPTEKMMDESYALIVISPQEFTDELQPLIHHKINRGVSTKLVTTEEIYNGVYFPVEGRDAAEKLKYFIKNIYDHWNTRYVLLVGGKKGYSSNDWWMPIREISVKLGSTVTTTISDLYYADLYDGNNTFCSWDSNHNNVFGEWERKNPEGTDDMDMHPDVYLGRLPCVDENEVETMVNKIIRYENKNEFEWFNRLILCGGRTSGKYKSMYDSEYIHQQILNTLQEAYEEKNFIGVKLWMSLNTLTKDSVIREINQGAGFISFSGHGGATAWATQGDLPPRFCTIWTKDLEALSDNNGCYPIAIIDACYCGDYSCNKPCFTWKLISHPDGGAIAGCASTDISFGLAGEASPTSGGGGLLELCFFKAYTQGCQTFGELWADSINLYLQEAPYLDAVDYFMLEEWQPFGDPSLRLRELGESAPDGNHPPDTPDSPSGNLSGEAGVLYTFNVSTTDVEKDEIYYLFDWGDGTDTGYLGPYKSGEVAQVAHMWMSKGTFMVRVKAIDMHGFESRWSQPVYVSIKYEHNIVLLIGGVEKTSRDGNLLLISNGLLYIDFYPFETRKYWSDEAVLSVAKPYLGVITPGFIIGKFIFGVFDVRFILEYP